MFFCWCWGELRSRPRSCVRRVRPWGSETITNTCAELTEYPHCFLLSLVVGGCGARPRANGLRSADASIVPRREIGQTRTTGRATTFCLGSGPQVRLSVERSGQSPSTNRLPSGTTRAKVTARGSPPDSALMPPPPPRGPAHWSGGAARGSPLTTMPPSGVSATLSPPMAATRFTKRSRPPSVPPAALTCCCSSAGGENRTRSPEGSFEGEV